ncbi:MAG: hypothetical protein H6581_15705 [Bacteroidia bacterium]|nr:hypothetical protein [Bacteroidia bacterium]
MKLTLYAVLIFGLWLTMGCKGGHKSRVSQAEIPDPAVTVRALPDIVSEDEHVMVLKSLPFPEQIKRHPWFFRIEAISQEDYEAGRRKNQEAGYLNLSFVPDPQMDTAKCFTFEAMDGKETSYCQDAATDENDFEYITYQHLGHSAGAQANFVAVNGYEWASIHMVQDMDGSQIELFAMPEISPEGEWLVSCADWHDSGYMPGGVRLLHREVGGWADFFNITCGDNSEWGASDPVWISETEFVFWTAASDGKGGTVTAWWRLGIEAMR